MNASIIQVLFRKNGEVSYARARQQGANKKVYYNQQSLEYVNRKLRERGNIDPGQQINHSIIAQTKSQNNPKALMAGPMGFEPMTFSLEG